MSPGEKRRRQRKREREAHAYAAAMAALPVGARCANCAHVDAKHTAPELNCDLDSDFHGYQIVAPDHRCPRWETQKHSVSYQSNDLSEILREALLGNQK